MISKFKSVLTVGALLAATAGAALFLGAGAASAQGTATPWAPGGVDQDQNAVGGITFYNSAGIPITGGPITPAPFAAFAQGKTLTRTVTPIDTKATLFAYVPQVGQTPDTWTTDEQIGVGTTYPNAAAPGALATSTLPVNQGASGNTSLAQVASDIVQSSSTTGYVNAYEIRMFTSSPGHTTSTQYDYADITINTSTQTWALVWTPGPAATGTTLTASPNTGVGAGDTVTLTATEAPAVAGSVQFENGGVNIGSSVPVNGSGVATTTTSFPTAGTENLSAVFTPTDTTNNVGSTGTTTLTVGPAVIHTSTALVVSGGNTVTNSPATLTATVTASDSSTPAGTIAFFDLDSATPTTPIPGTLASSTGNVFVYNVTGGFATGAHSVDAVFSTTATGYAGSTSAPVGFTTQAPVVGACAVTPANCTDTQTIVGTVPAGTIIITTPYTAAAPLNLGTLALIQTGGTGPLEFSAHAAFSNITVVDTRAGDLPYTVSATSSDLNGGSPADTIDSQNVGLTGVTGTGSGGFAGIATADQNPAADPAVAPGAPLGVVGQQGLGINPHTVGAVDHGAGTFTWAGTLTLNAPTSTTPGVYTGTITFTVG